MNLLAKIKTIQLPPALRSRNYRLFFAGQGLSLIGSWMTQVATIWLVYNLSDSPWMLGVVGFTSQIPTLILLPFAGVLIDHWNRHRVIIATQILAMVQSLALAFLALTGVVNIWQILVLSFFQGAINAFDAPARQAFVPELVEKKEDLANAIALNASMFNGARLIGPAIAGLLIATVGPSYCFLIDGLSYIAVIAGLLAMQIKARKIAATNTKPLQRLKEGFVYAFGFPPIRAILLLLALVSFAGMSHTVLVPIFATKVLQGGPEALGFLMAASGVGAFGGAIYLISRKSVVGLGKWIAISPAIMGCGLIGFGLSPRLVAVINHDVVCGVWFHFAICRRKHIFANNCGRRQTRKSDEHIHDGIFWSDTVWEFSCRRIGKLYRLSQYSHYWRYNLCFRLHSFYQTVTSFKKLSPATLSKNGFNSAVAI
ncbi:MFS transporter [Microcoleus vaginatus]|uniref:MFS transporter n=1 Tax=Microcoleus vaginatus TaxID=119532 RepID=UPI00403F82F6